MYQLTCQQACFIHCGQTDRYFGPFIGILGTAGQARFWIILWSIVQVFSVSLRRTNSSCTSMWSCNSAAVSEEIKNTKQWQPPKNWPPPPIVWQLLLPCSSTLHSSPHVHPVIENCLIPVSTWWTISLKYIHLTRTSVPWLPWGGSVQKVSVCL